MFSASPALAGWFFTARATMCLYVMVTEDSVESRPWDWGEAREALGVQHLRRLSLPGTSSALRDPEK